MVSGSLFSQSTQTSQPPSSHCLSAGGSSSGTGDQGTNATPQAELASCLSKPGQVRVTGRTTFISGLGVGKLLWSRPPEPGGGRCYQALCKDCAANPRSAT